MKKHVVLVIIGILSLQVSFYASESKFNISLGKTVRAIYLVQDFDANILDYEVQKKITLFKSVYKKSYYKGFFISTGTSQLYIHILIKYYNYIYRNVDFEKKCRVVTRSMDGSHVFTDATIMVTHKKEMISFAVRCFGTAMLIFEIKKVDLL